MFYKAQNTKTVKQKEKQAKKLRKGLCQPPNIS